MEHIPASARLHIQVTCVIHGVGNTFPYSKVVYDGGNFWQADQAAVKASLDNAKYFLKCVIKVWQHEVLVTDKTMHVTRSPDCIDLKYKPFW